MADGSASPNLARPFEALFRFGVVGDLSDEHLLRRFLSERDGADQVAFTMLVERHGPMVLRVCREILGNPHDAQDAFQATFLVLARKAASIRGPDSLAGWLHGVAHRIALQARSSAARRRIREQQIGAIKAVSPGRETSHMESWAELHEEVARLPRRYREPIVLCYLEGLSTEEAALRIGCPPGTIFSRLSRARDRLRDRLVRRGMAPCAVPFAAGSRTLPPLRPPQSLLEATVGESLAFAGRRATEAALGAAAPTALAKGLLNGMTISKLAILGTATFSIALAIGGLQAFGPPDGPAARRQPAALAPQDGDRADLTRSVEKIQADLDETARRTEELKKELRKSWARLNTLRNSTRLAFDGAVTRLATMLQSSPAQAVAEFAEALKRHPPRRKPAQGDRLQLYMMDLATGETTLIADEPDLGLKYCNTPKWSHDGTRIVFHASSWTEPRASRIKAIEVREGRPTLTDLGPGQGPTFSRDDKRIAFVLDQGAEPEAEAGVWVMQADGSNRRRVGEHGFPFWSPDGREFLVCQDTKPAECLVINLETREGDLVQVAGHRIFSWPSWAGPGRLVSSIGTGREGDAIALLDVREPAKAKIVEILWNRGEDTDVEPLWPVYWPDARRCIFVGAEPRKRTLYEVRRGESRRARPLEPEGYNDRLSGLSFSPDGRYLLFCANRPDRR